MYCILSTEETQTIDLVPESTTKKKKESKNQELDLLELNPEKVETTEDGSLKQEGEEQFDPDQYGGFPMEAWNRYFGSINDKRQSRSASLAKLSAYSVRYNSAAEDSPYPKFKVISLDYSFVTKKAWEKRRRELSEIEDLERQQQVQATKIAEMQESLRLRIFARNKPRGMVTNRDDPNKAQLEEIQNNMKFFGDISNDIGRRLAEKRQASDLYAFQMYFHKDKEVYDQIMNEDLDDILRACDWKQVYGSSNLKLSPPSSIPGQQQAIQ